MAIKHIGYGIIDKDGDAIMTEAGDIFFDDSKDVMDDIAVRDSFGWGNPPYKSARILIDDEVEE